MEPMGATLYLVRHGVTAWNREMRMQGHMDVPLDAEGLRQAEHVAARIAALPLPPEAVWCSDLSRARVTAEAVARALGLPLCQRPELREVRLGDWEGLTRADIEARGEGPQLDLYLKDSLRHRPPHAERLEEVWERMARVGEEIRARYAGRAIALVGHGASLRAFVGQAVGATPGILRNLWLDNASLTALELPPPGGARLGSVWMLNDTAHLREPQAEP
jgi:broad specificity phosphatase PhoE